MSRRHNGPHGPCILTTCVDHQARINILGALEARVAAWRFSSERGADVPLTWDDLERMLSDTRQAELRAWEAER
jgi:hypothetical protein